MKTNSEKKDLIKRTRAMIDFDNSLRSGFSQLLCGIDEAGRGPIAGPVVAAAVIFGDDVFIEGVFDSKMLTCAKREELFEEIINTATTFGVGIVHNVEIDVINILEATRGAMTQAVAKLKVAPGLIVADGNFYSNNSVKVENIVKADEKSFSAAAASIIAKVTRDRMMIEFEKTYPNFSFSMHKGYCTRKHVDELLEHGYTDIHRKTFHIKMLQGELF
jgi:ribonuclease HII